MGIAIDMVGRPLTVATAATATCRRSSTRCSTNTANGSPRASSRTPASRSPTRTWHATTTRFKASSRGCWALAGGCSWPASTTTRSAWARSSPSTTRPLRSSGCTSVPQPRGSASAGAILARLVQDARAERYATVRLETLRFMTTAQAMYRAFGFVEVPRFDGSEAATRGARPVHHLHGARPRRRTPGRKRSAGVSVAGERGAQLVEREGAGDRGAGLASGCKPPGGKPEQRLGRERRALPPPPRLTSGASRRCRRPRVRSGARGRTSSL